MLILGEGLPIQQQPSPAGLVQILQQGSHCALPGPVGPYQGRHLTRTQGERQPLEKPGNGQRLASGPSPSRSVGGTIRFSGAKDPQAVQAAWERGPFRHLEHRLVRAVGIREGDVLEFHQPPQSGRGQRPGRRQIWLSVQVLKHLLGSPYVAEHIPTHVNQGLENRNGGVS